MDLNNLKHMLKTEEKNCTFFDFELLLMLSFMKPKEFIPNATTFFIQQKPMVVFVKKPSIDEIEPRNQPFGRALIRLGK